MTAHADNERDLKFFLRNRAEEFIRENCHMAWAGDFNRHHPLWDRDEDEHLFTPPAIRATDKLINLLTEHDMVMLLPKDTPTLQHMVTERFSRPDNVFSSPDIQEHVTRCEVVRNLRPICTDHYPIVTNITLPQSRICITPNYNFREVDWASFRKSLETRLSTLLALSEIINQAQLDSAASGITTVLRETIQECVRCSKPHPDSKRWWSRDLRERKKHINKLRALSFRN
jgi:hypothetical protein